MVCCFIICEYCRTIIVQVVWATIMGYFMITGDVPLVYNLYAFFTALIGRPMIPSEYKWTVLTHTEAFWCRS